MKLKNVLILLSIALLFLLPYFYYRSKTEYFVKLTDHLYLACDERGEFAILINRDISRNIPGYDMPGGSVMIDHVQKIAVQSKLFVIGKFNDPAISTDKWFLINLKTDRPGDVDPEIFDNSDSISKSIEKNYGTKVPELIDAVKYRQEPVQ